MVTLEGTVEEIIFCNEVNGYTVCEIRCEGNAVTAVGYMPFICVGEVLKVTGKWVDHPDYGQQLKVENYEKALPQTADAIEKYLSSGVIKGIGPATAAKIVARFGPDTLNIMQFKPEMLAEVKGISLDKAFKIGQAYAEQSGLRTVILFFQEYGISPTYSMKIYKAFGENTIQEIKANPYRLSDEIFGIGFKTADRIARAMGIDPMSKYRISSGIRYVLSQAAANGHTFIPDEQLKKYTSELLEVDVRDITDALVSLMLDKAVYVEKREDFNAVYLSAFYHAEVGVCSKLAELSAMRIEEEESALPDRLDEVQREAGIVLAPDQKTAVREALVNGVTVITGGPGTGKTTIIKSIIMLLHREGCEVALAAPTGRAAKRMTEATGYEAKTIHRLLEIGFAGQDDQLVFSRSESSPIDADVVIIDEMSMVDVLLMNHLLKAIAPGTRLVLVGDTDQLPSVGPGNVLKDIIKSGAVKTVRLTEVFRQEEESMIILNAHRINRGEYPVLNRKDKDFFLVPRRSGEDIVKTVVELCCRRLPATYGYDPIKHIQVLTPARKGTAGVLNLNAELQKVLNPRQEGKCERVFHGFTFREGDRVMQVKNNYNLKWEKTGSKRGEGMGVFNGDTGIIRKIDDEEQRVEVLFEDDRVVRYDYSILDEIEPAFAITVHKSQGSEFPVAVLPIFPGPRILMTRNLLYTAVTRARDLVVLVGSENVLAEMISNERETLRYSGLADKLKRITAGLPERL
ncbi:MAG: ATP-dependent RecD-like DNA helicase [Clostridiales bacterium]|nr:ATP-dependent RecD-like DNA helicase [Eubacteriales bacterium]MDH7566246.1 ATP-dependent RecD-like DNA helicase [Clostridiales bacterium]